MVTFLDEEGPGRCDVPLCQHHYDLMVTTIIQLRTQGVTEVSD